MDIAIINNTAIVQIGHYKQLFPNTSFPLTGPDEEFMMLNSALKVTIWKEHDITTQKIIHCDPYIEDNQVFTVTIINKSEDDIIAGRRLAETQIRTYRDQLLAACDWTQITDVPVDKADWAAYRQELRDITNQPEFPTNVVYPVAPNLRNITITSGPLFNITYPEIPTK